jgi:arginine decarboxylase
MIISNRLPYEYFVTTGRGQSDAGSKGLPFETGSYDAALNDAGIENANIMVYSSVIPTEAKEISKEEGLGRIKWGQVIESIKAEANGKHGQRITAAVMITAVHDPRGKYLGGFACEYSGSGERKDAEASLLLSVKGMIERRGYGTMPSSCQVGKDCTTDRGHVIHPGKKFVIDTLNVTKKAGSVLAAICFMSFRVEKGGRRTRGGRRRDRRRTRRVRFALRRR